jgi:ribosomal protein S18 acetylase RimI-like enzyme
VTLQVRPLTDVSWPDLAAAFNEGFSDYSIPVSLSPETLAHMLRRRGYVAQDSFGAYDGERLVGFVFTCRDGTRAYNSGTGVAPSHRRRGVARALLDAVIARVDECVLEVLEDNVKAITLYTSAGFVERRRFQCWTYAGGGGTVPELRGADLDAIAARADVELSWQNSCASIRRATEPHVVLGDERGAALVFPASGDLPLLAVDRAARLRGHGARLLAAAAARASRPLRILNIDVRAAGVAAFMAAVGATPLVRQIELVRAC